MDYGTQGPVGPMGGGTGRTMNTQRFLVSQGYNIAPDGVMGPLTQAALVDWHSGANKRNSATFNQKHGLVKGTTPGPSVVRTQVNPPSKSTPTRTTAPSGKTAAVPSILDQFHLIDPASYAHSAVAAQYGPQIAALAHQQAAYTAQEPKNIAQIQGWYNSLLGDAKGDNSSEDSFIKDLIGSEQKSAAGLSQAAGGSSMADAINANSLGHLESLGANQDVFNTHRLGDMRAAGVEAQTAEHNRIGGLQSDIASQLAALQSQKGNAYNTALGDAWNNRNSQLVAEENAKSQEALLPYQVKQAALANAGQVEQNAATHQNQIDTHKSNLQQLALNALQLKIGRRAQSNGGIAPLPATMAGVDLKTRQALRKDLISGALDANGAPSITPAAAYNAWGNALRSYSDGKWNPYQGKDPAAATFRDNLIREYIAQWNSTHDAQHQSKFVPGKGPVRA